MLISGIFDEMSPSTKLRDIEATTLLSYFFCQATDDRINNTILQDPSLKSIYLITDALDEYKANLDQLLDLISQTASTFPRVKWIISSRNEPYIKARLRLDYMQMRLSLKLNKEHISRAIQVFIDFKVSKLRLIKDDSELQEIVRRQIYAKANKTFLWAALVLQELEPVESWDVLDVLQDMPPELVPLYDRMLR
ncbi:beta transducin-like protein HET-D2Y [Rhexocercosporidium sp. MPI-PUGE-AT-0058]|nr:beta transducin-like protein HET-D2Y [Rhexocercosporidium sp. MPI-PUGE-AT-0058]